LYCLVGNCLEKKKLEEECKTKDQCKSDNCGWGCTRHTICYQ
jgi:hypothetical protein